MKELYEHDGFPYEKWLQAGLGKYGEGSGLKKRIAAPYPQGGGATNSNLNAISPTKTRIPSNELLSDMDEMEVPNGTLRGTHNKARSLHKEGKLTTWLSETQDSYCELNYSTNLATLKASPLGAPTNPSRPLAASPSGL